MASHTRSELRDAASVLAKALPAAAREHAEQRAAEAAEPGRTRVFDGLRDAA
jgi:hypothetical protein